MKMKRMLFVVIFFALLSLSFAPLHSYLPVEAAGAPKLSPHTPVSSDGSLGVSPNKTSDKGLVRDTKGAYSPSFTGSGKQNPTQSKPSNKAITGASEIGISAIIGTDDRTQITNTTSFPYRAIVYIETNRGRCTGWMIGPHTVATAGHCVHSGGSNGQWATWARVYPGKNGSSNPYGYANATNFKSVVGWTQNGNHEYDYGAIQLDRNIGNSTGWFGFRWQAASYAGEAETITGYPGEKNGTMWTHENRVHYDTERKLYYQNDTTGGQSGSPVYQNRSDCGYCGIGIHAYGSSQYNSGTRITEGVFNNLLNWKNEPLN